MKSLRTIVLSALFSAGPVFAVNIEVDNDYDLFLDDGETMKKITVVATDASSVTIEMKGLAERLRIPRSAIRSARLIVKQPFFKRWEVGLHGDFHLAQADLTLLAKFFPMGSISLTGHLSKPIQYVAINALYTEINYLFVTDGERQIQGAGFAAGPRWHFFGPKFGWVIGAGGGMTGLYLKSYNFTRTSYAGMAFVETGITKDFGKRIRAYGLMRANYWSDSQVFLASVGFRMGASFSW